MSIFRRSRRGLARSSKYLILLGVVALVGAFHYFGRSCESQTEPLRAALCRPTIQSVAPKSPSFVGYPYGTPEQTPAARP